MKNTPITTTLHWTGPDFHVRMASDLIVDRVALVQAVARITAVTSDDKRLPPVGLTWKAPQPLLCLCIAGTPDLADDPIEAEVSGRGRLAVQVKHLTQLLDELESVCVRIDAGTSAGSAVLITNPHDANFTIIQMPYVWSAQAQAA
jgi:DNA polymerase-3 subunit beta